MESLQRQFRCRQVNKWMCIVHFDKNITTNRSFDNFIKLIQAPPTISLMNLILTKITKIADYGMPLPLSTQTFFSAFVIYGFKDTVIEKSKGVIIKKQRINDSIIKSAKEVVESYDSLHNDVTINNVKMFYNLLKEYKEIFNTWKSNDVKNLVHTLTTTYYELQSTIEEAEEKSDENNPLQGDNLEFIDLCKIHQTNILEKIVFLNGRDYFNNYQHQNIQLDEALQKHIQDLMYNAYWDILKNELNSDPPQYDQLIRILEELRELFCEFIPNRADIQQEIRDKIDPELIKNMVSHGAFDDENLFNLAKYIISLVKRFQPPAMDNNVTEWEESMLEQFKQKIDYSTFLVTYFRSIFNMIHSIVLHLNILKEELEKTE
jgi:hypothetical protein